MMRSGEENDDPILKLVVRCDRKLAIHLVSLVGKLYFLSFSKSPSCHILSKAFSASKKAAMVW